METVKARVIVNNLDTVYYDVRVSVEVGMFSQRIMENLRRIRRQIETKNMKVIEKIKYLLYYRRRAKYLTRNILFFLGIQIETSMTTSYCAEIKAIKKAL